MSSELDVRSIVTSRVPNGWRGTDTDNCSEAAGLPITRGQSQQTCNAFGSPSRPTYGSDAPARPNFNLLGVKAAAAANVTRAACSLQGMRRCTGIIRATQASAPD